MLEFALGCEFGLRLTLGLELELTFWLGFGLRLGLGHGDIDFLIPTEYSNMLFGLTPIFCSLSQETYYLSALEC